MTYRMGQIVWPINQDRESQTVNCVFCDGARQIYGANGQSRYCPVCHGKGTQSYSAELAWRVSPPVTIGQIRTEQTGDAEPVVIYMCHETGIGTGRLWKHEGLFESHDAASEACLALNSGRLAATS